MAKKKNKNYRLNISRDFLKTAVIIAIIGGGIWFWQNSKTHIKKVASKKQNKIINVVKNTPEPPASQPTEIKHSSAKSITTLFSKETWLDDYLQVETDLDHTQSTDLIVATGIAPSGTDPETIKNPDKLKPRVLVVRKKNGEFVKLDQFDFPITEPTEEGGKINALTGIPRITKNSLVDLDKDGHPELIILFDTHGKFTEAVAFLKWEKGKINWIKTKDPKGNEKIALWPSGSTATEAQEIIPQQTHGKSNLQVVQKIGKLDPEHPEKGFKWKTIAWEYKNGFLREKN